MYLRGIQFSEMESIMQFIYHGEATFFEERMDEFLAVAKSLEIKELIKAETESNYEPEEELEKQTVQRIKEEEIVGVKVKGKLECDRCHKTYSSRGALYAHKQSTHSGVLFSCDQCDYEGTLKSSLTKHIQSKHESVRYACDHCDSQFTQQRSLTVHIQSK